MYKGKVKNIIGSGAAFISSNDVEGDVYCNKRFVAEFNLKTGEEIEFESKMGFKNQEVTKIKKSEKLNPLLEMALKINKLTAKEYDQFCDLTKDYVHKPHFKDVTTSKIRNIFSAIQNAKTKKDLKMLRPKLAYLAGRDNKTKSFMNDLDKLIKKIENDEQVNNFKQFFEAIVCYKREIE